MSPETETDLFTRNDINPAVLRIVAEFAPFMDPIDILLLGMNQVRDGRDWEDWECAIYNEMESRYPGNQHTRDAISNWQEEEREAARDAAMDVL